MVRGKAGKSVEFGAKISASCFEGYVFLGRMSWDSFNESGDLKAQVEAYHRFTGYYPESVHADRIYRTRENRAWCKEKGIRISGPPLGRPPANVSKEKKKQALEDERIGNAICQESLDKANADLVSLASWQNLIILHRQLLLSLS
jgi:hypothetical protein